MKYKHLFFDLDHTLWDFEANARATLLELHAALLSPAAASTAFQCSRSTSKMGLVATECSRRNSGDSS
ncbi:MAG TPA: hypothetical protein VGG71_13830, partial [Chitinophagaceae bacterium]